MTLPRNGQDVSKRRLGGLIACAQRAVSVVDGVNPALNALCCTGIVLSGTLIARLRRGCAGGAVANLETEVLAVLLAAVRLTAPFVVATAQIEARVSQVARTMALARLSVTMPVRPLASPPPCASPPWEVATLPSMALASAVRLP